MERLRTLFSELKFQNVETFLASGNVLFDSKAAPGRALEARIEKHLEAALGYAAATFLRTPAELRAVCEQQPFDAALHAEAVSYNIGFLHEPPSESAARSLLSLQNPDDFLRIIGRELYWLGRKKQSESIVSNRLFERALGVPATLRGQSTLMKLLKKYPGN